MRRNFHVSLVLALAFLFSLSTVAIAAPAYVYGNVTDDRLVEPIEGAALIVWDYHNPDTAWYDTTDVNGDYWIQLWSSLLDTFVVKVTATGFTPDSSALTPRAGADSVQIDFALTGPAMGAFDSSLVVDSICQDDTSLFERVLSNVGDDPLEYTVEWDSAWIEVVPDSGELGWLERDTLQISLIALTGMVGEYYDTIVIVNNSPTPAVHIPVQLTAWPLEAYIDVDTSSIDTTVYRGEVATYERVITNTGWCVDLTFDVATDTNWLTVDPTSDTIPPNGGTDTLTITCTAPDSVGVYDGQVTITSNDPNNPTVVIDVTVEVVSGAQIDSSLVQDSLCQGDSSVTERVLTNLAPDTLKYTVEWDSAWIVVMPDSGELGTNDADTLQIWLYALTGMLGEYYDTIVVVNNSKSPAIRIPVQLTALPPEGVEDEEGSKLPSSFALGSCYPNPFNASTTIGYDLPRASRVTLEVYNLVGQKVATLVNGYEQAGYRTVNWNAAEVTTGIYYYKLTAGEFVSVRKLTLLK